jgi:hypothetical protein
VHHGALWAATRRNGVCTGRSWHGRASILELAGRAGVTREDIRRLVQLGILDEVRDLGLSIIAVRRLPPPEEAEVQR